MWLALTIDWLLGTSVQHGAETWIVCEANCGRCRGTPCVEAITEEEMHSKSSVCSQRQRNWLTHCANSLVSSETLFLTLIITQTHLSLSSIWATCVSRIINFAIWCKNSRTPSAGLIYCETNSLHLIRSMGRGAEAGKKSTWREK